MWRDYENKPFENHKMGPFQGFKRVPCTKARLLEGPSTFWPKNDPRCRPCHLMSQKSLDPSKSLCFVTGPFVILEMAPFSDFQWLIS
jgi:hypothetical protein